MVADPSVSTDSCRGTTGASSYLWASTVGDPHGGGSMAGPASLSPSHPPARSSRGHRDSRSPMHQAPHWGWGWAEAGPGHGPVVGPGSAGPIARQGRAVGSWRPALLWGLMVPGELTWGPGLWAGRGSPRGLGRDQSGLVVGASRALTT